MMAVEQVPYVSEIITLIDRNRRLSYRFLVAALSHSNRPVSTRLIYDPDMYFFNKSIHLYLLSINLVFFT